MYGLQSHQVEGGYTGAAMPKATPTKSIAPVLNKFIMDKFPKDYKGSGVFAELAKTLEEFLRTGEKGTKLTFKFIVKTVMARLGQYEYLPPAALPLLIACFYAEDRRLARCGFYMAQRLLGPGAAGTPLPVPPGDEVYLAAAEMKKADVIKAWPDVNRPDANPYTREFQLRMLAAAGRSIPECLALVGDAVKAALMDCGIDPKSKKGAGTASAKVSGAARGILLKGAFTAARTALPGKPSTLSLVAKRAFHGVDSPNPVTARHALALMAQLAVTDAAGVEKDIRTNVGIALQRYVSMRSFDAATALRERQSLGINMDDTLARVYLARICGMVLQLERKDGESPFFKMLAAFAAKDPSDLVALEAIRSLAGTTLPLRPTLHMDTLHPLAETQAAKRAKAWTVLVRHCEVPKGDPAAGQPPKLMVAVRLRLRRAMQLDGPGLRGALVAGALRAAAALAEARARATAAAPPPAGNTAKGMAVQAVDKVMGAIQEDVTAVLDSPHSPAIRALALTALVWLQPPGADPILAPERMYTVATSGGVGPPGGRALLGQVDPWPQACLAPVVHALVQAAKATPATLQYRLECAMALTRAAPARVGHEALLEIWRLAAQGKPAVRNTAVASVLSLLACDPPPGASAPANASHAGVLAAAAEDAGWTTLQRLASWWLGEHANGAAGEWAGQAPPPVQDTNVDGGPSQGNGLEQDPAGGLADAHRQHHAVVTRAELAVREASRSPVLLTVLQALQRALSTGSWHVRVAAVESIGKIAVRSPEPFRIYCYALLSSVGRAHGVMSRDVLGVVPAAQPMLEVLDLLYTGTEEVEAMAQQYGLEAISWPDDALHTLRTLHERTVLRVEAVVGKLPVAGGYPLGPISRALLTTDVEEERKQREEDEIKRNPDKWRAVEGSDSDESEFEREPAPWDRPEYGGGQSGNPWGESDREEDAPWDSRPPWERRDSKEQGRGGNPWDSGAESALDAPLPWERREPAPWAKQAEASSDEDDVAFDRATSRAYEYEATTTVKDDYWDSLGGGRDLEPSPSATYSALPQGGSYNELMAATDYAKPYDSEEEAVAAAPRGSGIVRHEFAAEGEEELTVEVGDRVDVFEDHDGWLLCRRQDTGAMGLVPATYVEEHNGGAAVQQHTPVATKQHRREPTLGGDEDVTEPLVPTGPEPPKGGPKHRREPTFEFEEAAGGATAMADAGRGPSFEFGGGAGRRGKVIYAFDAEDPEELTVAPGDVVVVHKEVDGWYSATRVADGTQGLVPSSYVEVDH